MQRDRRPVTVNFGTFRTVKKLKAELEKVLDYNEGTDVPLRTPVEAIETQQGTRYIMVELRTKAD